MLIEEVLHKLVRKMMASIPVDSFGLCIRRESIPECRGDITGIGGLAGRCDRKPREVADEVQDVEATQSRT